MDNIDLSNVSKFEYSLFNFIDNYPIFSPYMDNIYDMKHFDLRHNPLKIILDSFNF
jgi:hypothetical protein